MICYRTETDRQICRFPYSNGIRSFVNRVCTFHDHEFWEFSVILRGSATNECADKTARLSRGDVYLMRPADNHQIYFDDPALYYAQDVYVTQDKMRLIADSFFPGAYEFLSEEKHFFTFHIEEEQLELLENDFNYFNTVMQTKSKKLEVRHTALVGTLLKYCLLSEETARPKIPEWLSAFTTQLRKPENIRKKVGDVIGLCPYSYTQTAKIFKAHHQMSVSAYFTKIKMQTAAQYLIRTETGVEDVAYAVGYENRKNFIKNFKAMYGITPLQYRFQQTGAGIEKTAGNLPTV